MTRPGGWFGSAATIVLKDAGGNTIATLSSPKQLCAIWTNGTSGAIYTGVATVTGSTSSNDGAYFGNPDGEPAWSVTQGVILPLFTC